MRSFSLCLLALACDRSGPPVYPPLSPYPSCPSCQHAQFVVSEMKIPQSNAQALQFGCEFNSDGQIYNQLGKVLGAFKAASQSFDPQVTTKAAFQSGSLIMLYDVEYEPSLTTTQVAGLRAFIGEHDASDGLAAPAFYMGQGRFTVGFESGGGLGGSIQNGAGDFGPNDAIAAQFVFLPNEPVIVVPLQRGYVFGTFTATTIQDGRLCGAIDARVLRSMVDPQLADMFSAFIKQGGFWANPEWESLVDTDHSCPTDPACQPSSPASCHCVTVSDMENSTFINSLLNPDLDLDPTKTNPWATDPDDPTYYNDALSIGVGITANAATFPLP